MKQIVLCDLKSGDRQMTTWLDKVDNLKEGVLITLKDYDSSVWKVERIYKGPEHYTQDFDFHRKWDNNNYDKHMGLKV